MRQQKFFTTTVRQTRTIFAMIDCSMLVYHRYRDTLASKAGKAHG